MFTAEKSRSLKTILADVESGTAVADLNDADLARLAIQPGGRATLKKARNTLTDAQVAALMDNASGYADAKAALGDRINTAAAELHAHTMPRHALKFYGTLLTDETFAALAETDPIAALEGDPGRVSDDLLHRTVDAVVEGDPDGLVSRRVLLNVTADRLTLEQIKALMAGQNPGSNISAKAARYLDPASFAALLTGTHQWAEALRVHSDVLTDDQIAYAFERYQELVIGYAFSRLTGDQLVSAAPRYPERVLTDGLDRLTPEQLATVLTTIRPRDAIEHGHNLLTDAQFANTIAHDDAAAGAALRISPDRIPNGRLAELLRTDTTAVLALAADLLTDAQVADASRIEPGVTLKFAWARLHDADLLNALAASDAGWHSPAVVGMSDDQFAAYVTRCPKAALVSGSVRMNDDQFAACAGQFPDLAFEIAPDRFRAISVPLDPAAARLKALANAVEEFRQAGGDVKEAAALISGKGRDVRLSKAARLREAAGHTL